jgi:hypothetical protein
MSRLVPDLTWIVAGVLTLGILIDAFMGLYWLPGRTMMQPVSSARDACAGSCRAIPHPWRVAGERSHPHHEPAGLTIVRQPVTGAHRLRRARAGADNIRSPETEPRRSCQARMRNSVAE